MNTTTQREAFESWGLLELFGHQRLAGRLSEQMVGGVHFIRIDVPATKGAADHTRFYTQGAIYGMTVLSEATARAMAESLRSAPVSAYHFPGTPALPSGGGGAGAANHTNKDFDDLDDELNHF
jgi:hypothetical protein